MALIQSVQSRRLVTAIGISIAAAAACRDVPRVDAPADAFIQEDAAVFAAVFARDTATGPWEGVTLSREVGRGSPLLTGWPEIDTVGVPAEALRDFERRNRIAGEVSQQVARQLGTPLVNADSVVAAAGPGAVRWPHVIHLSRPGYGADGASAIVTIGSSCGLLCGSSSVLLLVRTDAGWSVSRSLADIMY